MIAIVVFTVVSSMFAFCQLENGWDGLRVFRSTKVDVESALGKPVEVDEGVFWYETEKARFRILFSEKPCSGKGTLLGGFSVKEGSVLQYQVHLKQAVSLSDLKWKRDLYEREEDRHRLRTIHYYNSRDGIRIETHRSDTTGTELVKVIYFERTPELNAGYECKF